MNDHEKNQLLENLFGDDDLERLRQTSLSRGLNELRRRRQRTLAGRISVMALPVLLLAVMAFHHGVRPQRRAAVLAPTPPALPRPAKAESKVEYITADQLFALFPNRPMALVGKPGHQHVIFLDDDKATVNQ